jgi:hypothetical protein
VRDPGGPCGPAWAAHSCTAERDTLAGVAGALRPDSEDSAAGRMREIIRCRPTWAQRGAFLLWWGGLGFDSDWGPREVLLAAGAAGGLGVARREAASVLRPAEPVSSTPNALDSEWPTLRYRWFVLFVSEFGWGQGG